MTLDASTNASKDITDKILILKITVTELYRKENSKKARIIIFTQYDTAIRKTIYNTDVGCLDCQDLLNVNEAALNYLTFVCKNVHYKCSRLRSCHNLKRYF